MSASNQSTFAALLLALTVWNSCQVRHIKDQIDLVEKQADAIEFKVNDQTSKLGEVDDTVDQIKSDLDDVQ